jgi:hypothetical protein
MSISQEVTVYEDEKLYASSYVDDQRKTIDVKIVTDGLISADMFATVRMSDGAGDWVDVTLSLNGRMVDSDRVYKGGSKALFGDVTDYIEGGNVVQITMSSRLGYWSETIWDVHFTNVYSADSPPPPPIGTCPFPIMPRLLGDLSPFAKAPFLCSIWGKIQDMRVGQSIMKRFIR